MYSGGDSSAATLSGSIDWAQLAQQWIQMRDNTGSDIGDAPPPPTISINNIELKNSNVRMLYEEEKGEADMDMDDDETDCKMHAAPKVSSSSLPQLPEAIELCPTSSDVPIQQSGSQWFPPTPLQQTQNLGAPRTSASHWNTWTPRVTMPPQLAPTTTVPVPVPVRPPNPTTNNIPSLLKINVPNPNATKSVSDNVSEEDGTVTGSSVTMDAAKRKILPAWIREGLEKMEREKQKQLEKRQEEQSKERSSYSPEIGDVVAFQNKITVKSSVARELASDDSSGNEGSDGGIDGRAITTTIDQNHKLRQRFSSENTTHEHTDAADNDNAVMQDAESAHVGKSYEQKLTDLMITVRHTLTELLLEVTNEEISQIAHETLKSRKMKASSVQVIRKSALSSITGKLGLAAYGESSSDESSGDDDDDDESSPNEQASDGESNDSEEEIKNTIRMKRRAFAKISEEIEGRIAAADAREEQKLKYYTHAEQCRFEPKQKKEHEEHDSLKEREELPVTVTTSSFAGIVGSKGFERDFGETSESKLQHSNGKRTKAKERSVRRERSTRFSDNKDTKSVTMAAAATYISQIQGSANANVSSLSATINTSTPDPNGLYNSFSNSGITNVLSAAEAALEKATKRKSSRSPHKQERGQERGRKRSSQKSGRHTSKESVSSSSSSCTSSSSTSSSSSSSSSSLSSKSGTSSSHSSHYSKYSHSSAKRHKVHKSNSNHSCRSRKSKHLREHKSSRCSGSTGERGRDERTRRTSKNHDRRYNRHYSGDSDNNSDRRHTSSHQRNHHMSSRRKRSRSRSRSYSSNKRRH